MKKTISLLVIAVLLISAATVTAYARGCHGGGGARLGAQYELCTVEDCDAIGPHLHDDNWYCNQNWQGDFAVCSVEGCTVYGLHEHDGVYYHCQNRVSTGGCGRGWNR